MSAEFPTSKPTTRSPDARSDESRSRGSATSPSARIGQEALAKMPTVEEGKWARLKGRISRYYESSLLSATVRTISLLFRGRFQEARHTFHTGLVRSWNTVRAAFHRPSHAAAESPVRDSPFYRDPPQALDQIPPEQNPAPIIQPEASPAPVLSAATSKLPAKGPIPQNLLNKLSVREREWLQNDLAEIERTRNSESYRVTPQAIELSLMVTDQVAEIMDHLVLEGTIYSWNFDNRMHKVFVKINDKDPVNLGEGAYIENPWHTRETIEQKRANAPLLRPSQAAPAPVIQPEALPAPVLSAATSKLPAKGPIPQNLLNNLSDSEREWLQKGLAKIERVRNSNGKHPDAHQPIEFFLKRTAPVAEVMDFLVLQGHIASWNVVTRTQYIVVKPDEADLDGVYSNMLIDGAYVSLTPWRSREIIEQKGANAALLRPSQAAPAPAVQPAASPIPVPPATTSKLPAKGPIPQNLLNKLGDRERESLQKDSGKNRAYSKFRIVSRHPSSDRTISDGDVYRYGDNGSFSARWHNSFVEL